MSDEIMNETTDVIIVAAGSGTRLGYSIPKAFVPLNGKPILSYSIDFFLSHKSINHVILVVSEFMLEESKELFSSKGVTIVTGGKERWQSVKNGVNASDAKWVMIHDAARPFVTTEVVDSVLQKKNEFACIITATPVVDTIREFSGDIAGKTIDREKLIRVGTPQLFNREILLNAFASYKDESKIPTDEAMLIQEAGISVGISWGDPNNFKITTKSDLVLAETLIKELTNLKI
jgi:2-C-methyl-D-erythritol 4-phosphate cytidylyltransferase